MPYLAACQSYCVTLRRHSLWCLFKELFGGSSSLISFVKLKLPCVGVRHSIETVLCLRRWKFPPIICSMLCRRNTYYSVRGSRSLLRKPACIVALHQFGYAMYWVVWVKVSLEAAYFVTLSVPPTLFTWILQIKAKWPLGRALQAFTIISSTW